MEDIVQVLANKWYIDCMVYDLPVSPSDIRDIIEELIQMKKEKED